MEESLNHGILTHGIYMVQALTYLIFTAYGKYGQYTVEYYLNTREKAKVF